jgi:hypothetical protein
LEGNKNIETYQSVEKLKSLKTFSTSNSRAKDKSLEFLQDIENVFLGAVILKTQLKISQKNSLGKIFGFTEKQLKENLKNSPFKI